MTGATVATVGGAMIVAGVMVGRTTPGSATHKDNNENVNEFLCCIYCTRHSKIHKP